MSSIVTAKFVLIIIFLDLTQVDLRGYKASEASFRTRSGIVSDEVARTSDAVDVFVPARHYKDEELY